MTNKEKEGINTDIDTSLQVSSSKLLKDFKEHQYAVVRQLFSEPELKDLIELSNEKLRPGTNQTTHEWKGIPGGDGKREYRILYLEDAPEVKWLLKALEDKSEGIIHKHLKLNYMALIKSLRGCNEQKKHIDASSPHRRGLSVLIAVMKGTYIISYMNGQKESIQLEAGDVIFFSNAFEHGGGAYDVQYIGDNPFYKCEDTHCRLFLIFDHMWDPYNAQTFNLLLK